MFKKLIDNYKASCAAAKIRIEATKGMPLDAKVETTEGTVKLSPGGWLEVGGFTKLFKVEEVDVEFVNNGESTRMSAGRVVGGTVLLGPLGTVVGGMAKKTKSNSVLIITPQGRKPLVLGLKPGQTGYAERLLRQLDAARTALAGIEG